MGVALCFFTWGIWAENGKWTLTFKYLIRFSKPRACWMQNHERIVKILKTIFFEKMGVALYFLIWDIWAKNGQLAVTLKHLI